MSALETHNALAKKGFRLVEYDSKNSVDRFSNAGRVQSHTIQYSPMRTYAFFFQFSLPSLSGTAISACVENSSAQATVSWDNLEFTKLAWAWERSAEREFLRVKPQRL